MVSWTTWTSLPRFRILKRENLFNLKLSSSLLFSGFVWTTCSLKYIKIYPNKLFIIFTFSGKVLKGLDGGQPKLARMEGQNELWRMEGHYFHCRLSGLVSHVDCSFGASRFVYRRSIWPSTRRVCKHTLEYPLESASDRELAALSSFSLEDD